jgi:hypothetical protein
MSTERLPLAVANMMAFTTAIAPKSRLSSSSRHAGCSPFRLRRGRKQNLLIHKHSSTLVCLHAPAVAQLL